MSDENSQSAETGGNNENSGSATEKFVEKGGERLSVSDNFWDSEHNSPDVFAILKSQQDLRKQIGEDLSPKDGVYQINIPDNMKDKLQADPEDPLYKEFCKIAKSKRMSQQDFDAISQIYYQKLYDSQEFDSEEYMQQESQALKAKFGNDLDKVKSRIDNFINNSGISDKDMLNELAYMQTSASGVALLDYLLSLRGEPMPKDTGSRAGAMSRAELENLMREPGYQNGTDKALIEKVTKGFELLYPER